MTKHVLDRTRSRLSTRLVPYTCVRRRMAPEGGSPAAKALIRRRIGPWNAALRTAAFVRIDRGYTV